MTTKIEDGKIYELTGSIMLDRTPIYLDNVKVKGTTEASELGIGKGYIELEILDESKDVVNVEIESCGNVTLVNALKGLLWEDIEGKIAYNLDDLKVKKDKKGIIHIIDTETEDWLDLREV